MTSECESLVLQWFRLEQRKTVAASAVMSAEADLSDPNYDQEKS